MNMMSGHEHGGGMDHSADMAMAGMEDSKEKETAPAVPAPAPEDDAMDVDPVVPPPSEGLSQAQTQSQDIKLEPSTSTDGPQLDPEQLKVAQELKREDTEVNGVQDSSRASQSPRLLSGSGPQTQFDPSQTSPDTFLSAAMDGIIRIWDKRAPAPVARIGNRVGVPPWCMSACWSPNGNMIYAGRRNGTVEEFDVRKAKRGWEPERVLKFPAGSGAVSAVKPMVNGRHLVCASHDIMRLYDLRDTRAFKHSTVPFLIIPGPPRAGVISSLYVDPTSRYMLSAAGTRGWEGSSTEVLIGYEINVVED
uniref:Transcription factor spt8 beta-propeller domain-containing protein n=1 Tax=Bionectria ochroleuca TaxID=29856 RepID=A0A8H7KB40_BIOOC